MKTSGYSETPLTKKLGLTPGCTVTALFPPDDYEQLLDPVPPGAMIISSLTPTTDLVHIFVVHRDVLETELRLLRNKMKPNASVWVSWPKKASKVPTDITEDTIRDVCLPMGFVDIKVCAVNDMWSGLKLVIRKELRGPVG